jgi:hypothetical protein
MQKFKAPLALEDQKVARRIGRLVLIIYSATVLALTAGVLAHIAFKNQATAGAPIEVTSKVQASGRDPAVPDGFMRAGSHL